MEMKKDYKEQYCISGQDEIKEYFKEIEDFVYESKHGVALVDESESEKLFTKNNINDLFCLVNENNLKEIEYIQDDFLNNETANDSIKGFIITLINQKKYTIELL